MLIQNIKLVTNINESQARNEITRLALINYFWLFYAFVFFVMEYQNINVSYHTAR